jgi:hypothetical protein
MSLLPLAAVICGYVGATGIVLFAVRSMHAAMFRGRAASLDPFDFAVLAAAGAFLTAYALSSGDAIFLVTNMVSAVCNGIVAALAVRARRGVAA